MQDKVVDFNLLLVALWTERHIHFAHCASTLQLVAVRPEPERNERRVQIGEASTEHHEEVHERIIVHVKRYIIRLIDEICDTAPQKTL